MEDDKDVVGIFHTVLSEGSHIYKLKLQVLVDRRMISSDFDNQL